MRRYNNTAVPKLFSLAARPSTGGRGCEWQAHTCTCIVPFVQEAEWSFKHERRVLVLTAPLE